MITVNERIAEVGLLRGRGGTIRQVRVLFLGEALMLGLIGGICGLLVVLLALLLIYQFAPGSPLAVTAGTIVAALGISILIGLVAGVRPATRGRPNDAYRCASG